MPAITLSEAQAEIVAQEAEHIARSAGSGDVRAIYGRLADAAKSGELPEELAPALGELLTLGLVSGRIRGVHGPHGELEAAGLYRRTPQGKAFHAQFDEVNAMFAALAGQRIRSLSLSARGPGLFTLTVETDEARVTANLFRDGVDVRSVEVAI